MPRPSILRILGPVPSSNYPAHTASDGGLTLYLSFATPWSSE